VVRATGVFLLYVLCVLVGLPFGHAAAQAPSGVIGEVRIEGNQRIEPESISSYLTLKPGDLIYSGTPAGVGPVKAGDKLEGHVDGVGDLMVTYVK